MTSFLTSKSPLQPTNKSLIRTSKETDEKITLLTEKNNETHEKLKLILATIKKDKNDISKSSPAHKDPSTPPDPTTMVQTNKRAPPLEGGIFENIGGMWTLKHEISSPRFYELLIKIELKGDTTLDLNNFYNHVKMSLEIQSSVSFDFCLDEELI